MQETYRILAIDAWRDPEGGWTWNAWYDVGSIDASTVESWGYPVNARRVLRWFREAGYLTAGSAGRCAIEDDGYNITVLDRRDGQPLIAVEYGAA